MNNLSSLPISRWAKIFTFLIVAFPILDIYAVGVKGISIGSILLSIALIRVLFSFFEISALYKMESVLWILCLWSSSFFNYTCIT